MFLDALGMLSDAQAMAGGATTIGTNKIDLGAVSPRRDIGIGEPMCILVSVDVDFGTTADTIQFDVLTDEDAAMGSPTVLLSRAFTYAAGVLAAGTKLVLPLPQGPAAYERYLGYQVTVSAGGSITCSAYVVPLASVDAQKYYPKNYGV